MTDSSSNYRNDPAIKKLLTIVYILYFLGLIESILLPTHGLIMILGFSFILFQSKALEESSYIAHYRWLIICTVVLLLFTLFNIIAPIQVGKIHVKFQSKYIGQILYFILVCYGFFCLLNHKPLPSRKNSHNTSLTSKK